MEPFSSDIEEKKRILQEMRQEMFQHKQSLEEIHSKFPNFAHESPLFVTELADNLGDSIVFPENMENALCDLEGWEYCWISILTENSKGEIGEFTLNSKTSDGLNSHACAVRELYGNESYPFVELQSVTPCYILRLEERRIKGINRLQILFDSPLPAGIVIEFKVYHPEVESLTMLHGEYAE